jgi:hypothetical protein
MPFTRLFSPDRDQEGRLAQSEAAAEDPFLSAAPTTRKATAKSIERRSDPVEEFLREQKPISAGGRASVVSYEQEERSHNSEPVATATKERLTAASSKNAKVASKERIGSTNRTSESDRLRSRQTGKELPSERHELSVETTSTAAKSKARPFPTADALAEAKNPEAAVVAKKRVVKTTELTQTKRSTLKPKNPLSVEELPPPPADSTAVGAEQSSIAALLQKSKGALKNGDHARALQLAVDAQRRAAAERYVFKRGESRPEEIIAAISASLSESTSAGRQLAAAPEADRPRVKATTASFSGAQSEVPPSGVGIARIGRDGQPVSRQRPPVWPKLATIGGGDSDQLWQPAAGIAHIPSHDEETVLRRQEESRFAEQAERQQRSAAPQTRSAAPITQIASMESSSVVDAHLPVVELGAPTEDVPVALAAGGVPTAKSSRLIAPPPLAIEQNPQLRTAGADAVIATAKPVKRSRTAWYGVIAAALSIAVLIFRRRAYGSNRL